MTVRSIDILRSANTYRKRYGEDAEIECAARCDAFLSADHKNDCRVWRAIYRGIIEMRRADRKPGEAVN